MLDVNKILADNIYIFGAGNYGKCVYYELLHERKNVISFIDNDESKNGKYILNGVRCVFPFEASTNKVEKSAIIIANRKPDVRAEIHRQVDELGFKEIYEYGEKECSAVPMKLTDEEYIRMRWAQHMGDRSLDLHNPSTFNEKIQWLKLFDRNPLYTTLVDKYAVKRWVTERIGEEYIIPTLGVWERFDDIDFEALPDSFVLKCTHDSGSIVFCQNKRKFNQSLAKKKLEKSLSRNYFWESREWQYKNVLPRIIAEPLLIDENGKDLMDYKVQNFDGIPKFIQVDFDRFSDHKRNLYDCDWNYIPVTILYPTSSEHIIEKPKCLDKMLQLASKLSSGLPYVRTDFYIIGEKIYFGEMTFHHGSGFEKITPFEFEEKMSTWMKLPKIK